MLKALGGVLAILATAWFTTDALQAEVCQASYLDVKPVQMAVSAAPRCDGESERLTAEEANDFFYTYLAVAGGAEPRAAAGLFATSARERNTAEGLEKEWGNVLWAEPTEEAVEGEGFNEFVILYRTYHGDKPHDDHDFADGSITDWKMTVRLVEDVDDDSKVRIKKILAVRDTHIEENQHYPRIRANADTKAYGYYPTPNADPTAIKWRAGASAPALCWTAVPPRSKNYWFRTRLGWVDGAVFRIEEEWPAKRDCAASAAMRAAEVNRASASDR